MITWSGILEVLDLLAAISIVAALIYGAMYGAMYVLKGALC